MDASVTKVDEASAPAQPNTSQCIDWYSKGETRVVEVGGVRIEVRFVGRRGRRGRISITGPAGAVFMPG